MAASVYLLRRSRFETLGAYVPGHEPILFQIGEFKAYARPGTEDLGILVYAHEGGVSSWFRPRPHEVFVDVGAHIGTYSLRAGIVGARVIAIEPNPDSFRALESNFRLNHLTALLAVQSGVGEAEGFATVEADPLYTGQTRLSRTGPRAGAVPVRCLDDLLSPLLLDRIDWLKIDVEGGELGVLKGARRSLARTDRLIIELERDNEFEALSILMNEHEFRIVETDAQADVVYYLLRRD